MKRISWIKLIAVNLLLVLMIISPFLPGPPNKAVIGLSVFAQLLGFFGLLLVPLGVIWIILELRKSATGVNKRPDWKPPFIIAIYSILVIGGLIMSEYLAGFSGIAIGAFALWQVIREIRKLRHASGRQFNPTPLYLLIIPLVAFTSRKYLAEPLADNSRRIAIERSEGLIAAIEDYKIKEGQYPESLQDLESGYLKKIPSPFIMGILNFRYNKIGEQYSLSFSQWREWGSLEEIVLYEKDNLKNNLTGKYAGYDYSFDLCRVKGAFASHDAGHDYWRYYFID